MSFLTALLFFLGIVAFLGLCVAAGLQLFALFRFSTQNRLESLLFSAGIALSLLQVGFFFLSLGGWLTRFSIYFTLLVLALVGWRKFTAVWHLLRNGFHSTLQLLKTPARRAAAFAIGIFLSVDFLMALAPLTGSDALHYHFTIPLLQMGRPYHPDVSLSSSFFTGQAHLFILAALTLGSETIGLCLLWLGGVLTAAAIWCLARQLMPCDWALLATLTFTLTPLVFWQMSVSGAPDIWMAFYTTLAVLAARRGIAPQSSRWVALAGFFAGAAAGVKYTGWTVPATLLVWLLVEAPGLRNAIIFTASSLAAGIYPLLRNFWFAGDPFFPFLTRWLAPDRVNFYALGAVLAETHISRGGGSWLAALAYPFLVVLKGNEYGVGHYFGPLVLSFAPLLFTLRRDDPLVRAAVFVWGGCFLFNWLTSEMGRYLLPVYPLALALVFSGAALATREKAALVRRMCGAVIALFLLFGTLSLVQYAKDFLPVTLGSEPCEQFLERMAPDYNIATFVNRALAGQSGKTVVFFRHLYYLRLPFLNANPATSWLMDPRRYSNPDQLLSLLREQDVRWVVKSPDYPPALRDAFSALERDGKLLTFAEAEVENFASWRLYGTRQRTHVTILNVHSELSALARNFVPSSDEVSCHVPPRAVGGLPCAWPRE
ncbi:MAG TPA: glycosyltransferase family 39 protein [Candidatus Acidoferrum sp.]|nr:glycosyltransferase family 39 protein [Candidatus Acidoferrum sp.]